MASKRILMTFAMDRPELEQAIREYALGHDWILERFPVQVPMGWFGDGMLTDYLNDWSLGALAEPGTLPIVSRYLMPGDNIRCVLGDTHRIGRMVRDYFINRGFEHFAIVERRRQLGDQAKLMCPCYALRVALDQVDLSLNEFYWQEHLPEDQSKDYRHIVHAIAAFLPTLPKPCAMFVPNVNFVQQR
jgi:DNA-binding LacI/PurR family transcriptional regulator